MCSWGRAIIAGSFFVPLALLAQHTAAAAPVHVTPTISHVSSPPSVGIRVPSVASGRTSAVPASAQGLHTAGTNRAPKTSIVKERESRSGAQIGSERHGLFSLLRKHHPLRPDSHPKCQGAHCSTRSSVAQNQAVAPARAEARLGCTVVPVRTAGIPCNALSPCCP